MNARLTSLRGVAVCVLGFAAASIFPLAAAAQTGVSLDTFRATGCRNPVRAQVTSLPIGPAAGRVTIAATFDQPLVIRGSDTFVICNLFFGLAPTPSPLTFQTDTVVAALASSNPPPIGTLELAVRVRDDRTGSAVEARADVARLSPSLVPRPVPLLTRIAIPLRSPSSVVNIAVRLETDQASPNAQMSLSGLVLTGTVMRP